MSIEDNKEYKDLKDADKRMLKVLDKMLKNILVVTSRLALENVITTALLKKFPKKIREAILAIVKKEEKKKQKNTKKTQGIGR